MKAWFVLPDDRGVAQLAERRPWEPGGAGSSPAAPTRLFFDAKAATLCLPTAASLGDESPDLARKRKAVIAWAREREIPLYAIEDWHVAPIRAGAAP